MAVRLRWRSNAETQCGMGANLPTMTLHASGTSAETECRGAGGVVAGGRRRSNVRAVLALCFTLALVGGCTGDGREETPPNIILLSIDTLRADRLGAYGYERPTSPTIDALAARGARFDRAFAESPWTLPSHMTMFTGLHPGVHGATAPMAKLRDTIPTLAERLREAGYRTFAHTGGGNVRGTVGFARGFEEYIDSKGDFSLTLAAGRQRIEEIDRAAPYFLFLHTYATHCPYTPDKEHLETFRTWKEADVLPPSLHCGVSLRAWAIQRGGRLLPGHLRYLSDMYDAAVRSADQRLAEFIAYLDERGEFDDTILIVVSDHGEAFHNLQRVGHESILTMDVLRVPLILVGRGIPAGRVVTEPAGLIDIATTVLAAARLPAVNLPGRSLLQHFGSGGTKAVAAERFSENNFGKLMRSVVDEDKQLIWHLLADEWQQYDLAGDPTQDRPLPLDEDGRRLSLLLQNHVEDIIRARAASRTRGVAEPTAALSEAEAERLRSLGYLIDEGGAP